MLINSFSPEEKTRKWEKEEVKKEDHCCNHINLNTSISLSPLPHPIFSGSLSFPFSLAHLVILFTYVEPHEFWIVIHCFYRVSLSVSLILIMLQA